MRITCSARASASITLRRARRQNNNLVPRSQTLHQPRSNPVHNAEDYPSRPKPRLKTPLRGRRPSSTTGPAVAPVYTRHIIQKISSILRDSPWESAKDELRAIQVRWDSHIVCGVLKTHPPMDKAWLFFLWAAGLEGFKHDQFTYTTMLDIFGEAGRVEAMKQLFKQMEATGIRVDVAAYTSLMHRLAAAGDFEGAVRAWMEMRARRIRPTVVSYTAYMKLLFDHGRAEEATVVYKEMVEVGVPPSCHTYTVLMDHLAAAGRFKEMLKIMTEMQDAGVLPDKAACNILVQRCSEARDITALVHVLLYMKENKLVLRRPVFLGAMEAFKNCDNVDDLLREVNPHLALEGIKEDIALSELPMQDIELRIDNDIIYNLLARKNFIAIEYILNDMVTKNATLDSDILSMIVAANSRSCRVAGAFKAFRHSVEMGKKLNREAYLSLLGPLIRENSITEITEVVDEMLKTNITLEPYLISILILKFGDFRMTNFAGKIFYSSTSYQKTLTFTTLIAVYLQNNRIDAALKLYGDVTRNGVAASLGTFEVLISALEEAGRSQEAKNLRKEKKKLQFSYRPSEKISSEERICDLLFDNG